jgi:hypothetical protein
LQRRGEAGGLVLIDVLHPELEGGDKIAMPPRSASARFSRAGKAPPTSSGEMR